MPSKMAENTHRFMHMGSNANSCIGLYAEERIICRTEVYDFSVGAVHRSSPVSLRSLTAMRFNSLLFSASRRWNRSLRMRDLHWMVGFREANTAKYQNRSSPYYENVKCPAPTKSVTGLSLPELWAGYRVVYVLMKPPTLDKLVMMHGMKRTRMPYRGPISGPMNGLAV